MNGRMTSIKVGSIMIKLYNKPPFGTVMAICIIGIVLGMAVILVSSSASSRHWTCVALGENIALSIQPIDERISFLLPQMLAGTEPTGWSSELVDLYKKIDNDLTRKIRTTIDKYLAEQLTELQSGIRSQGTYLLRLQDADGLFTSSAPSQVRIFAAIHSIQEYCSQPVEGNFF